MEMTNQNMKDIMAFHRRVMHEELAAIENSGGHLSVKERYELAKIIYEEYKDLVPISELKEYEYVDS